MPPTLLPRAFVVAAAAVAVDDGAAGETADCGDAPDASPLSAMLVSHAETTQCGDEGDVFQCG